jgi:hypothetical protein
MMLASILNIERSDFMRLLTSCLWQLEPIPFFFQRMIGLVVLIEELPCMISVETSGRDKESHSYGEIQYLIY